MVHDSLWNVSLRQPTNHIPLSLSLSLSLTHFPSQNRWWNGWKFARVIINLLPDFLGHHRCSSITCRSNAIVDLVALWTGCQHALSTSSNASAPHSLVRMRWDRSLCLVSIQWFPHLLLLLDQTVLEFESHTHTWAHTHTHALTYRQVRQTWSTLLKLAGVSSSCFFFYSSSSPPCHIFFSQSCWKFKRN